MGRREDRRGMLATKEMSNWRGGREGGRDKGSLVNL